MKIIIVLILLGFLSACDASGPAADKQKSEAPITASSSDTVKNNPTQKPSAISGPDRATLIIYLTIQKMKCDASLMDASVHLNSARSKGGGFSATLSNADKWIADGVPTFTTIVSSFTQFPGLVFALKSYRSTVNKCGSEGIINHARNSSEIDRFMGMEDEGLEEAKAKIQTELDMIPIDDAPNVIAGIKM